MKTSKIERTIVVLELNENEARWLRGLMHPLHGESPHDEPEDHSRHRSELFHALDWALSDDGRQPRGDTMKEMVKEARAAGWSVSIDRGSDV